MDLVIDFKVVLNISGSAESFFWLLVGGYKQFGQTTKTCRLPLVGAKTVWYLKYPDAKRKTYLALGTNAVIFWKGHAKGNSFGLRHIFLDRVIEKIDVWTHVPHLYSVFCIYYLCVRFALEFIANHPDTHTHSHMYRKWQIDFRSFKLEYERCTLFYHLIFDRDDFIRNGKICPWDIVPLHDITNKWWLIGWWAQPLWSSLVSFRIEVVSPIYFVNPASTECKTSLLTWKRVFLLRNPVVTVSS